MVGQEKALYKRLNSDVVPGMNDMQALSPPESANSGISPLLRLKFQLIPLI